MNNMHIDTNALSVQGVEDKHIAVLIWSDHYWKIWTDAVRPMHGKRNTLEIKLRCTIQGPVPAAADIVQCDNVALLRTSVEDQQISKLLTRFCDLP